MADKSFVLDSGGIALSPPPASQVTKFLCKQYLMMAVKANRDQLVEFCHLVVLLDLEHGHPPQDLVALVHDVMKNPEAEKLKEAIEELKDYADGLPKDPRKTSSALADAWKQSQKIREGRVAATLDKNLVPDHSSSNEISKSQIPIQVQVWSQTKGKLDNPASEIRCAVPRLSMVGNLDNIVRYAATRGFNFPYSSKGELRKRSENVKISSKAMLYSMSSNIDWVLRDKSAKLADVVDDAHRLQMVNTKLKTLAVAVAVLNPHKLSERFIFDISKPLELVSALRDVVTEKQVRLHISRASDSFNQTRFLKIWPEEVALLPTSSRDLQTAPHAIHSNGNPSPGAPASSSPAPDSPHVVHPVAPSSPQPLSEHARLRGIHSNIRSSPVAPPSETPAPGSHRDPAPVPLSQLQPPPAQDPGPRAVGPQASVDPRVADPRSPSPANSHRSGAPDDFENVSSQVPHDSGNRQSARSPLSANPMPVVSASSSSSLVVVGTPATSSAIISKPENQAIVSSAAPAKKYDPFYKRVLRKIGW